MLKYENLTEFTKLKKYFQKLPIFENHLCFIKLHRKLEIFQYSIYFQNFIQSGEEF